MTKRGTSADSRSYVDFYTEETKRIVAEWYKDDIEFFGFEFTTAATKNIWAVS
jgi:hypothetical protein